MKVTVESIDLKEQDGFVYIILRHSPPKNFKGEDGKALFIMRVQKYLREKLECPIICEDVKKKDYEDTSLLKVRITKWDHELKKTVIEDWKRGHVFLIASSLAGRVF